MLKNYAFRALQAGTMFVDFSRRIERSMGLDTPSVAMPRSIGEGEDIFSGLPLPFTRKLWDRKLPELKKKALEADKSAGEAKSDSTSQRREADEICGFLNEVAERLSDELEGELFYFVPQELVPYFDCRNMFGSAAFASFPYALENLEPAGRCLSLGEPTASVFHLMRAMEGVVSALCTKLGIPNPDREWGKLLSDMEAAVEAMPKGDQRQRWSEAHTRLYHLKDAWRNPTMHPKRSYQLNEGREVFDAVAAFMRQLALLI